MQVAEAARGDGRAEGCSFCSNQHFFRLGLWVAVMQASGSGSGFIFTPALGPLSLLCGHFYSQLVKEDVIINRSKLKHRTERKRGCNNPWLRCRMYAMKSNSAWSFLPSYIVGMSNFK